MQLADVLCYMGLTIIFVTTCVDAEEQKTEVEESQHFRRLSKRDATVIVDNYPIERIFQKPKVIYRRVSKQRYGPPKSKYGPPPRPKYRPSKVTRKPGKKSRKGKPKPTPSPLSYGAPAPVKHSNVNRKRASKPKYGTPKAKANRPSFGHIVKMPHYSFFLPDKTEYEEPPVHYNMRDFQSHKQSYGEPPVDSYGAPLKGSLSDIFPTSHSFQEMSQIYDEFNRPEYQWNHKHPEIPDTNYAYSNAHQYAKKPVYVTPPPKEFDEDSLDPDNPEKQVMTDNKFFFRKKRPFFFSDAKAVNKPWKSNKQEELNDEIIVGGQYAEPPARYVAKFPAHLPIYEDDEVEDTMTAINGFVDTDIALSANNSPYSNYKHSNMAFSPQNLNDAFSIVDK